MNRTYLFGFLAIVLLLMGGWLASRSDDAVGDVSVPSEEPSRKEAEPAPLPLHAGPAVLAPSPKDEVPEYAVQVHNDFRPDTSAAL